jgi:hypothetical protein
MPELERLVLAASLSPEQLKLARSAFDAAWSEIAENYKGVDSIELGRTRLATMVLGVMSQDCGDVTKIKDAALGLIRRAETPIPLRRGKEEPDVG